MGLIDKLSKKLKNSPQHKPPNEITKKGIFPIKPKKVYENEKFNYLKPKPSNEDIKKDIKSIKPKKIDSNEKYDLNIPLSENDLLKRALQHKYLKQDLILSEKLDENRMITKRTNNEVHYDVTQEETEAKIKKNMDYLSKSSNYTFVKDFVDRWGKDEYTKQSLKILHKRLNNKGFKIDKQDLKPLLIHIRESDKEKNLNKITTDKKLHPLLTDYYPFIKDFVNRFGDDDYPNVLFKRFHKSLNNKGFEISEEDLKPLLIQVRKFELEKQIKLNPLKDKDIFYLFRYKSRMFINEDGKFIKDNIPWLKKYLIEEKGYDQYHAKFVISLFKKELMKEYRAKEDLNKEYKSNLSFKKDDYLSDRRINSLSGFEFENFLHQLFQRMGYQVQSTKLSGDQGADLVISRYNEKIVVQAKRYKNNVGNRAVQEVVASIAHYGANKGMVVTNSQFTKSAVELARSNQIRLIDGNELNSLISRYLK